MVTGAIFKSRRRSPKKTGWNSLDILEREPRIFWIWGFPTAKWRYPKFAGWLISWNIPKQKWMITGGSPIIKKKQFLVLLNSPKSHTLIPEAQTSPQFRWDPWPKNRCRRRISVKIHGFLTSAVRSLKDSHPKSSPSVGPSHHQLSLALAESYKCWNNMFLTQLQWAFEVILKYELPRNPSGV